MTRLLVIAFAVVLILMPADSHAALPTFDNSRYAKVLATYVDEQGMVDYAGLKADRAGLDAYVAALGALEPRVFEAWPEAEQIAFWTNAYNAITLKVIIDHYPIESKLISLYPDNSIRQIDGAWKGITHPVMGRELTLDQIEHEILRVDYLEPRIHVALVCAAVSCPPLRGEPYTGARLNEQLNDQARVFLQSDKGARVEGDTLRLSKIFDWFGEDFVKGVEARHGDEVSKKQALFIFVNHHGRLDGKLDPKTMDLKYLDYDWTLNEQGHDRK